MSEYTVSFPPFYHLTFNGSILVFFQLYATHLINNIGLIFLVETCFVCDESFFCRSNLEQLFFLYITDYNSHNTALRGIGR